MCAKWIWYPGDFEMYHNMLVHTRREAYGYSFPVMWKIPRPEITCSFSKHVSLPEDFIITVHTRGTGCVDFDGRHIGSVNTPLRFPAGEYDVTVTVQDTERFPAIYINSVFLDTDTSWTAHFGGSARRQAAADPVFSKASDDPSVFPFRYKELDFVSSEPVDGGMLYDCGTENFGPVYLDSSGDTGTIHLYYGESREEALDKEFCCLREHIPAFTGTHTCMPRAFRYLYLCTDTGVLPGLRAELEYLPLKDKASFVCNDEKISRIWDLCVRTFHLNSREFFFDGIKRDRWVWGGDACQSFMINRYLFKDPGLTRRTLRALLGKGEFTQHINTINDYSAYMFIAVQEYVHATGDTAFLKEIMPRLLKLYHFIVSRLDPDTGYVIARPGDWIFIDWADLDKDGPLCAEQILLYRVYLAMAALSRIPLPVDEDDIQTGKHPYALSGAEPEEKPDIPAVYLSRAETLKEHIIRDFWDPQAHAFIDSFTSGKHHITRHANIFAVIYGLADETMRAEILTHVLMNDNIDPITTPYFKMYELMALAETGQIKEVQEYIRSYWGGMLDNGASTAWEVFDPAHTGTEHYAMYGEPYGCSLCHAWGSGPIFLLGRYCAGVRETSFASASFEVAPQPGIYTDFEASVPVSRGTVTVKYHDGQISVYADIPGGTLKWNDQETDIPCEQTVTL